MCHRKLEEGEHLGLKEEVVLSGILSELSYETVLDGGYDAVGSVVIADEQSQELQRDTVNPQDGFVIGHRSRGLGFARGLDLEEGDGPFNYKFKIGLRGV